MAWFRSGRSLFRSPENAVWDALAAALPVATRGLLEEQLSAVGMVQRHSGGREVNLYTGRRGRRPWPSDVRFPNQSREIRLATVRLKGSADQGRAEISAVKGHVFQIVFRPPPGELGDPRSIGVVGVTLHSDPMQSVRNDVAAELLRRMPGKFRSELETLWDMQSAPRLITREELYTFELDDGTYLMLGQRSDTDYVALRLDPPEGIVRRIEVNGEVTGRYTSIAEAWAGD
jgi:hypothetical protein